MRFTKPIATALALTVGALSFATTAEAGHRHRHHHGDAAVLGLLGFATGALIANALSQPRYGTPSYYYYQPQPLYAAPPPVIYQPAPVYSAQPTPWSPEWHAYCNHRFVSFDDRTGYYRGFDGEYRFCR